MSRLSAFAGSYEAPGYGRFIIADRGGKLDYKLGAVYGPVEIYDATKDQMRIELVGSGTVLKFTFPDIGPATSIEFQNLTFNRVR